MYTKTVEPGCQSDGLKVTCAKLSTQNWRNPEQLLHPLGPTDVCRPKRNIACSPS